MLAGRARSGVEASRGQPRRSRRRVEAWACACWSTPPSPAAARLVCVPDGVDDAGCAARRWGATASSWATASACSPAGCGASGSWGLVDASERDALPRSARDRARRCSGAPSAGAQGPPGLLRPSPWVTVALPLLARRMLRLLFTRSLVSTRRTEPRRSDKEVRMPNEDGTPTVEELKAKAYQPMEDAMELHPFYRGKIETTLKCCVRDFDDFGIWYTPGVSAPCLDIKDDPEKVYEHTNKWQHGGRDQRRHARAGHGRHRPQGRPAGDGGQEPALQVPRRRRRLPAHGRHQGPGQVHRVRQARAARAGRGEPRGHQPSPSASASSTPCARSARSPSGTTTSRARPASRSPAWSTPSRWWAGDIDDVKHRLHRLRGRQRRHQPPHLRLRRRPREVPHRRQQGHPPQGPQRHRGRQGRVGRQVEVLPDHQRRAAHRRHRRGAQGRRRLHRPQQAGPRHDREGLDQGDGTPTRSSSSAPTPSPRCGPGTPRRPAPPWWPPAAPTSPTRSTTRSASPASSAARWTCAPRRSPTRCASPRPWSSPRWPRTRV